MPHPAINRRGDRPRSPAGLRYIEDDVPYIMGESCFCPKCLSVTQAGTKSPNICMCRSLILVGMSATSSAISRII